MTTIGKILVFLVFVAALAMGGLMVYVSRSTPNWAVAVKERDEVINLYKKIQMQDRDSREKLLRDNEKMRQLLDSNSKVSTGSVSKLEADIADLTKRLANANELQKQADLRAKMAQSEAQGLQKELELLTSVVATRDAAIVKLQGDIAVANTAAQAAKNDLVTATARNLDLMAQLRTLEKGVAEAKQPKSQPNGTGGVRDASYSNPPPVYVKGRVEQVNEADRSLVKITIGSDAGLQKDQTLDVFRVSPTPQWLGRLLIVDADLHHSVGKLLRQPGMPLPTLQPGDEVASKLRP
jgi:hypothetical protein